MSKKITRRTFLEKSAQAGAAAAVGSAAFPGFLHGAVANRMSADIDISVVQGGNYGTCAMKAVEMLGGMKKFVSKGAKVAILPNAQRHHPGTHTKPAIVKSVIKMCLDAGAKEVTCLSWLPAKNWELPKLDAAIKEGGGELKLIDMDDNDAFRTVEVPDGIALKEANIMKALDDYDVFINLPVTKDHAGNKFTGTLKNMMGINGRKNNRGFHKKDWTTNPKSIEFLDQCIADLNTVVKPDLHIVDATEFITTNGPMGPGKLAKPQKVVAGTDRIAIDSYCTHFFGLTGEDIFMIKKGFAHGLGQIDLSKVTIKEVKV